MESGVVCLAFQDDLGWNRERKKGKSQHKQFTIDEGRDRRPLEWIYLVSIEIAKPRDCVGWWQRKRTITVTIERENSRIRLRKEIRFGKVIAAWRRFVCVSNWPFGNNSTGRRSRLHHAWDGKGWCGNKISKWWSVKGCDSDYVPPLSLNRDFWLWVWGGRGKSVLTVCLTDWRLLSVTGSERP